MATSGTFSASIHNGHYALRVEWFQTKLVESNASNLTVYIYLVNDYSIGIGTRVGNIAQVNGETLNFSTNAIGTTGSHMLFTAVFTVPHEADGSKTVPVEAIFHIRATINGTYYSSITAKTDITLDSIPIASSVTAVNTDLGHATSITIDRVLSSFTHTLTYSFGNTTGTIVTKTSATTVTWTPPLSLANQIPNATSGLCTITCITYNGSTVIGSKVCILRLFVPASVKPGITSMKVERINGDVPDSWGIYVQHKSKCQVTIESGTAMYGSSLKAWSITGGGYSSTTSTLATGFLNTAGRITFTATVTDSRGRTSDPKTISIDVVGYSPPAFTGYTTNRCNSSGDVSNDGTYLSGKVQYTYSGCNANNKLSSAVFYRAAGTSDWTYTNKTFSYGTPFTFGEGNISAEKSYEIRYVLSDTFTSIAVVDTVSTASVVMDFKKGGSGVAVGKVSETDKCFEVADDWAVKVHGQDLSEYINAVVSDSHYGICASAASSIEKVVICKNFKLEIGAVVAVRFTYTNIALSPTMNVGGTGANPIVLYGSTAAGSYCWYGGEVVLFVYDGDSWCLVGKSTATVTNYGLTKLTSSISSASTTLAATASAVKAAYDRNSWTSISLTNALDMIYGGTGATTASAARTNLGITATSLYSGVLTTGSLSFSLNYKVFVIIGQPSTAASRISFVIPSSAITTTAMLYQLADESNYYAFSLSYSDTTVTLAFNARSSTGQILRVFGVN